MRSLEDKDSEEVLYTNFNRTPVRSNFNRGRLPGRYPGGHARGYHVGRKRSSCRKCGMLGHFIIQVEHKMRDLQTQLFEIHAEETAHMVDDCIEEDESEEAAVNDCMEAFRIIVVGSHAPITPNFPSGSSREIVGDDVEKYMLAHHFSHYYRRRC